MKKYLAFILGSIIFVQSGPFASATNKNQTQVPSEKKISTSEKIKEISKKVALAPIKTCWWVIKYNLIAAGVLMCDMVAVVGGTLVYAKHLVNKLNCAIRKLESTNNYDLDKRIDLISYIQSVLTKMTKHTSYGNINTLMAEIYLASTIADLIKENKFDEAYRVLQERRRTTSDVPSENVVEVNMNNMDEVLRKIDEALSIKNREEQEQAARALFEYIHSNFVRRLDDRDVSISSGDQFRFVGAVDTGKIKLAFRKLTRLSNAMAEYEPAHRLVVEFAAIKSATRSN